MLCAPAIRSVLLCVQQAAPLSPTSALNGAAALHGPLDKANEEWGLLYGPLIKIHGNKLEGLSVWGIHDAGGAARRGVRRPGAEREPRWSRDDGEVMMEVAQLRQQGSTRGWPQKVRCMSDWHPQLLLSCGVKVVWSPVCAAASWAILPPQGHKVTAQGQGQSPCSRSGRDFCVIGVSSPYAR